METPDLRDKVISRIALNAPNQQVPFEGETRTREPAARRPSPGDKGATRYSLNPDVRGYSISPRVRARKGKISPLAIEPRLIRKGQKLLHQQCWLWGADIRRKEGNLLLEYGFDRCRAPKESNGCSQYVLDLGLHRRIALWGFGLYYGGRRGIYLNRYGFIPRVASLRGNAWTPDDLQVGPRSRSIYLLDRAVRWIVEYEQWVTKVAGSGYRGPEMYLAWQGIASSLSVLRSLTAWRITGGVSLSSRRRPPA